MLTAASHWLPSPWPEVEPSLLRPASPFFPPFFLPFQGLAALARSPQDSPSWRLIMVLRRYQPTRPPA